MTLSNPLLVDKSYPGWQALQSDLTRYYEKCMASNTHTVSMGYRKKQHCAATAWKIARASGKHNGYFTRMQRRASEYTHANDYPTFEGAIATAKKSGAAYMSGDKSPYTIYVPHRARGGFITRQLFRENGNWHIGSDTRFVTQLPSSAHSLQQLAAENPMSTGTTVALVIGGVVLGTGIIAYLMMKSAAATVVQMAPSAVSQAGNTNVNYGNLTSS